MIKIFFKMILNGELYQFIHISRVIISINNKNKLKFKIIILKELKCIFCRIV